MKSLLRKSSLPLAVIGVLLIINNLVGVFVNMRNPAIYTDPNNEFPNDITLTEAQFYQALGRISGDRLQVLTQMTALVNTGIAHNWHDYNIAKYDLTVPVYKNFILFGTSFLWPDLFAKYQFVDYHRAVERGVGLCSQQVFILVGLLAERGIQADIVGLDGHVVATASVDQAGKEWWIFDPDYGVIIPDNISTIEANPELVRPYYVEKGYKVKKVDTLVGYYGKEGNKVTHGIVGYSRFRYYYEYFSYVMIWVIPLILFVPLGVFTIPTFVKKGKATP